MAFFNRSFRLNSILTISIELHEPDILHRFREGSIFIVIGKVEIQNMFYLDYDFIESKFLKHPYKSDCIEYAQTGYDSKGYFF